MNLMNLLFTYKCRKFSTIFFFIFYSKLIKPLIITVSYLNLSTKNIEDNKIKKYFTQKVNI